MPLRRLILNFLKIPAQSPKDLFLSLSWLQLFVSVVSFGVFVGKCMHYGFIKPRPADCGKMGFKFKIPLGFFCLKIG
jgi:hypothetical protein